MNVEKNNSWKVSDIVVHGEIMSEAHIKMNQLLRV